MTASDLCPWNTPVDTYAPDVHKQIASLGEVARALEIQLYVLTCRDHGWEVTVAEDQVELSMQVHRAGEHCYHDIEIVEKENR